eukprot:2987100-Rhodomonas_salina.1
MLEAAYSNLVLLVLDRQIPALDPQIPALDHQLLALDRLLFTRDRKSVRLHPQLLLKLHSLRVGKPP